MTGYSKLVPGQKVSITIDQVDSPAWQQLEINYNRTLYCLKVK